jgi:hypothetical protein
MYIGYYLRLTFLRNNCLQLLRPIYSSFLHYMLYTSFSDKMKFFFSKQ